MNTLTLDTNAARDLAWAVAGLDSHRYATLDSDARNKKKSAILWLRDCRDRKECEFAIAYEWQGDISQNSGNTVEHVKEFIGEHVPLSVPGLATYPIRYPAVYFDERLICEIFAVVFPQSRLSHRKYERNRRDVLLLYAHLVAGRDWYLTSDGEVLRAACALRERWGIRVGSFEDYSEAVRCGR